MLFFHISIFSLLPRGLYRTIFSPLARRTHETDRVLSVRAIALRDEVEEWREDSCLGCVVVCSFYSFLLYHTSLECAQWYIIFCHRREKNTVLQNEVGKGDCDCVSTWTRHFFDVLGNADVRNQSRQKACRCIYVICMFTHTFLKREKKGMSTPKYILIDSFPYAEKHCQSCTGRDCMLLSTFVMERSCM